LVAACEILSSTHWNAAHLQPAFVPDWIVDISEQIEKKIAAFEGCRTEHRPPPHPRSTGLLRALAQFRGSQAGFLFGEAFQVVRMLCGPEDIGRS